MKVLFLSSLLLSVAMVSIAIDLQEGTETVIKVDHLEHITGILGAPRKTSDFNQYKDTIVKGLQKKKNEIKKDLPDDVNFSDDMLDQIVITDLSTQVVAGIKLKGKAHLESNHNVVLSFEIWVQDWNKDDTIRSATVTVSTKDRRDGVLVGGVSPVDKEQFNEYKEQIEQGLRSKKESIKVDLPQSNIEITDDILTIIEILELTHQIVSGVSLRGLARINHKNTVVEFSIWSQPWMEDKFPEVDATLYDPQHRCGPCASNSLRNDPLCGGRRLDGCNCCVDTGRAADYPFAVFDGVKYIGYYSKEKCDASVRKEKDKFAPRATKKDFTCVNGHFRKSGKA